MGIFDSLTNLSPDQNQGLLAAAAALLQAGGPSRTPTSFGQALGGGLQAYQQGLTEAEQRRLQRAQQEQIQKLTGLKIQDAESDLANQAAQRQRANDLRDFYIQNGGGGNVGSAPQQPQQMQLGSTPVASTPQSFSPEQGSTQQNAPAPSGAGLQKIFQDRIELASKLRSRGFAQEADAQEASALKFQPKVKEWSKVQQGGRVLYAPFYEDGSSGQPVPLDVAEKLQFQNTGGKTLGLNPFTGQKMAEFANTATPGEQLSAGTAANRLAFDVGQANRPVFNAEAGGYILPVNKTNPQGGLINVPGVQGKAATEFQGKSAGFGVRAVDANRILNELEGKYSPSAINSKISVQNTPLIGGVLGAATNTLALNENDQKAEQAQRNFVNAVLRQESGASISPAEFENASKQYFPQPGDTKGVLEQKARNRELSVIALQSNAGKAKLTPPAISSGWSIQKVGD